ncbi:unnamed protein product [Brassica oleracea]
MATLAAAIVMSLNNETNTLVVATLTAEFQHTPPFLDSCKDVLQSNVMVSWFPKIHQQLKTSLVENIWQKFGIPDFD